MRRTRTLAAACVVVATLYLAYFTWLAAAGDFNPIDFNAFYTGAALVRDGHGARLYDLALQARYQLDLLGRPQPSDYVVPFVSPPYLAVVLVPLAYLPLGAAFTVWTLLQLVLVAWLARECARPCATPAGRVTILCALAVFPMLFVTLYKGQLSLVVLVSVLAWMRAFEAGRDGAIATALLVGTVKPQMILVPVLITACRRRWRALLFFAGGWLFLVALAAAVAGPGSLPAFLDTTRLLETSFDNRIVYPTYMYNFKGALTSLLGIRPALIGPVTRLGLLLVLVAVVGLFWRRRQDDDTQPLRLALALLLGIFFSLHLYYYDALLLVAVAVAFDAHLRRMAPGWRPALLGLAYAVPLLFLETGRIDLGGDRSLRWPAILMLGWMLVMAAELLRRARSPRMAPTRPVQRRTRS